MSTVKISGLPVGSSLSGSELVPVVQGSSTVRTTVTAINQASPNFTPVLTAQRLLYVRTVPVTVTISISSPAIASWAGHGLQVNDPVVFSAPYDRYGAAITNANPGIATSTFLTSPFNAVNHGYANNDPIAFTTSGTLPTGLLVGTTYYVVNATAQTFEIAAAPSGAPIDTTGTQSGFHRVQRVNTLPTNIINGGTYYVIAAGYGPNSFQFSTSVGGPAVNTAGTQAGRIIGQTGNDSNNGLAQTRTGACLTLSGCYRNSLQNVDLNGNTVIIQMADGTYINTDGTLVITNFIAPGPLFDAVYPWAGEKGLVEINGNMSFPDQCYIDRVANQHAFATENDTDIFGHLYYRGFRVSTHFGDAIVIAGALPQVTIQNIHYETCNACVVALTGGIAVVQGYNEVLSSPSGGSLYIVASGGYLVTDFNAYTMAIGTINIPFGFYQAADNWGLPSFIQDGTHDKYGIWTGRRFTVAYTNLFVDFTFPGFQSDWPAGLTSGLVSPQGFYLKQPNQAGQVQQGAIGLDGATHDIYYNYQKLAASSAFNITVGPWDGHLIIDSTSTVSSGTITMPPDPMEGRMINVRTSATITSLSVAANSSQFILSPPTTLTAGTGFDVIYRSTNSTWYCG